MKIYTVGDSHCWHAWLKIPNVETKTIGPMTMFRFGQDKPIVVHEIPDNSIVCFCWGEIDCRCHVHKHQPWKECIDKLVADYFEAIKKNAGNHTVWIYNVVPPPHKEHTHENPGFPFLGTDEERLSYVRYMNDKLRETEYTFVDIYDKYADKDGFLIPEMSDGHVHIADERYLREWIETEFAYDEL